MEQPEGSSSSTAPRNAQPSPTPRQRPSLPSRSTSVPDHRSANRVNVPPASPEVISSLISSLSAISTPAQNHFDDILPNIGTPTTASTPIAPQTELLRDSPRRGRTSRKPSQDNAFGLVYGAYKAPEESADGPLSHPDDAVIAPFVRMAKAPWSESSTEPDASPMRPGSGGSHASSRAPYEEYSGFGMISAEPGPRASTAVSVASSSSGGRKSLKGQFGLLKKASRERVQEKETDRLRRSGSYSGGARPSVSRGSRASLRSMNSMADLTEEAGPCPDGTEKPTAEARPASVDYHGPLQLNRDALNASPGGIGSGRIIPTRESSLRHSHSSSLSKKRRSARHYRFSSAGSKDLKLESDIAEVSQEAEQVTKRIEELKEQQKKIKSEMEIDNTPGKLRRSASHPRPQVSRTSTESASNRLSRNVEASLKAVEECNLDPQDESAPAPAVLTGKSSTKRNSGLLTSRTAGIQSQTSDHLDKNRSKRLSDPAAGIKSHKRTSSGPLTTQRLSMTEERPSSSDSIDDAVNAYIHSPKLTQRVSHPQTGRTIAFSEVGDPKGHAVICCLGMGLTRYLMAFYDELARTQKLRLITPDRPGVGESEPCMDGSGTPLNWPDDVAIICNSLRVTKFSILAHSAGAIYALATALRMPHHIRGRLHLLAPWIPPSQLSSMGTHKEPVPANAVPYSQRILRALPTPILKVANASFMSTTSASITSSLPKHPRKSKRKGGGRETPAPASTETSSSPDATQPHDSHGGDLKISCNTQFSATSNQAGPKVEGAVGPTAALTAQDRERQSDYDNRLTHKIWELATTNANPAVDLLICLERRQTIGFRYVDINRAVVIHHGSRDTRVPVDNVRWLGKTMRRCEVRVLEGEGHGLMASAVVMSNVLTEIAKEWDDWTSVVRGRREGRSATISSRTGITV
ncbi:hypothetical protein VTN02DRAFT_5163 [Thermoascus thermophilus]